MARQRDLIAVLLRAEEQAVPEKTESIDRRTDNRRVSHRVSIRHHRHVTHQGSTSPRTAAYTRA